MPPITTTARPAGQVHDSNPVLARGILPEEEANNAGVNHGQQRDTFHSDSQVAESSNRGFSFGNAIKNFFKGIVSPVMIIIENPLAALPMIVACAALAFFIPATIPFMLVGGGAFSLFELGKGVTKAITASNANEREESFKDIGTGVIGIFLTLLGIRGTAAIAAEAKATGAALRAGATEVEAVKEGLKAAEAAKSMSIAEAFKTDLSLFSMDGVVAIRSSIRLARVKKILSTDINKLITGLNETNSKTFLKNMESLLKRMSMEDLLKNERILDILHQRYTKLGNNIINQAGWEVKGGPWIKKNPMGYFRVLETWRQSPTGCTLQNPLVHGPTTRYHVANEIAANTVLEATHGGGWRFIIDFLLGKNGGYQIDPAGVGIMVSPLDGLGACPHSYANRLIGQMFDSPAILRFKVPAQSLIANGRYEAGLLPIDLNMISDIELTNLYTGQVINASNRNQFLALLGLN